MLRLGLCCLFLDAPIKFRTATHRYVSGLDAEAQRAYLTGIAEHNAAAVAEAVRRCRALGIGAFRINSQILPLATHPVTGYTLDALHGGAMIRDAFAAVAPLARREDVRLSFHPDQFVVLNSERASVRAASIEEFEFQCGMAALVGADTVTLHVGGAAGGKDAALDRLERSIGDLTPTARGRLALENDDRLFTPRDLLPLCTRAGVPLVYDSHHHRCNPDDLSPADASHLAAATWSTRDTAVLGPLAREPWFHVSSPRDSWDAKNPRPHADYIDVADVPEAWLSMDLTVDVEAKAKERAVLQLQRDLAAMH